MKRLKLDTALRVSTISILINAALSAFKFIAGAAGHSSAMISDGVHSASDVISTIIVIIGVRLSSAGEDNDHQYGHERFEDIASLILAFILFTAGAGIGLNGILNIMNGQAQSMSSPGVLALIAAVISIAVKEGMFQYTMRAAKKVSSSALRADAWHHRSDSLSSIGSLSGILGARLGFPICDSLAGIVISAFIIKTAISIFRDSSGHLTDKSCDPVTVSSMEAVIQSRPGVRHLDLIHTRTFSSKIYVDIEISADAQLPLWQAHEIAEDVHHAVEDSFKTVKHCTVHVNPYTPSGEMTVS